MGLDDFLNAFFSLDIISQAWPILLQGFWVTLWLSALVIPLGLMSGTVLALLSTVHSRWVAWPLWAWVDFFRAIPPLVLLVFIYAGLPFAGFEVSAVGAVALAQLLQHLAVGHGAAVGADLEPGLRRKARARRIAVKLCCTRAFSAAVRSARLRWSSGAGGCKGALAHAVHSARRGSSGEGARGRARAEAEADCPRSIGGGGGGADAGAASSSRRRLDRRAARAAICVTVLHEM
jgi:His/Glu/Gln/Arg/opine family amino acid ABC transporter permease subunit